MNINFILLLFKITIVLLLITILIRMKMKRQDFEKKIDVFQENLKQRNADRASKL